MATLPASSFQVCFRFSNVKQFTKRESHWGSFRKGCRVWKKIIIDQGCKLSVDMKSYHRATNNKTATMFEQINTQVSAYTDDVFLAHVQFGLCTRVRMIKDSSLFFCFLFILLALAGWNVPRTMSIRYCTSGFCEMISRVKPRSSENKREKCDFCFPFNVERNFSSRQVWETSLKR